MQSHTMAQAPTLAQAPALVPALAQAPTLAQAPSLAQAKKRKNGIPLQGDTEKKRRRLNKCQGGCTPSGTCRSCASQKRKRIKLTGKFEKNNHCPCIGGKCQLKVSDFECLCAYDLIELADSKLHILLKARHLSTLGGRIKHIETLSIFHRDRWTHTILELYGKSHTLLREEYHAVNPKLPFLPKNASEVSLVHGLVKRIMHPVFDVAVVQVEVPDTCMSVTPGCNLPDLPRYVVPGTR